MNVWYDVREDSLLLWQMNLADAVMEAGRGNVPGHIKTIETTKDFTRGRLIGSDNSILEFIGEL